MKKLIKLSKKIYNDSMLKNSMYLILANFLSLALGFFFWMIATRYYTPNDIGITSVILSSISLISTTSLIGLPIALIFYLPAHRENANRIINSCMIIGIIISTIFSLIFISGIDIFMPKLQLVLKDLGMIIIFIITSILMTISSLMTGAFSAGKRSSFHMIKENVAYVTKIFVLILLTGFGITGIILSWSIGSMVASAVGFFLLFKLWKYVPTFIFDPIIKDMAVFSIGSHIAGTLYNIPKFIFPIMILNIISAEYAGYFFISMTVAGLLYGISYSISLSFLAESSDKDNFWKNVNKMIRFNVYLLVPGLLLFMIFGNFVLGIFNESYANKSLVTLIILSIASVPISLIMIYNIINNAQKNVMAMIKINGMVAIMSIIFSIYLMKIWSIEGVAMAYLIANMVTVIFIIFRMKNPIEFVLKVFNGTLSR